MPNVPNQRRPRITLKKAGVEQTGITAEVEHRHVTKRARLLDLLSRPDGATINDLTSELHWLPHTTRAALSGLRKAKYTIAKNKVGGITSYAIVPAGDPK